MRPSYHGSKYQPNMLISQDLAIIKKSLKHFWILKHVIIIIQSIYFHVDSNENESPEIATFSSSQIYMWHKKTKQNKTQLTNLNLESGFPWHQTSGWKVKNLVDAFKYPNIVSLKQLNDWIFPFLSEYLCFKYVEPSVLSSRKHYKFQKQCLTDRDVLSTYYVGLTLAKCV